MVAEPRAPRSSGKKQPLCGGGLANRLQHASGFDRDGAADRVNFLDAIHALERNRDGIVGERAIHHAGLAAPRNHRLMRFVAQPQNGRNLGGGGREHHGARRSETSPNAARFLRCVRPLENRARLQSRLQFVYQIVHAASLGDGVRSSSFAQRRWRI